MYIGVPATTPLCVRLASSAARARPKSVIFDALLRAALEQDVGRLDVAVDQAGGVGGGQPLGDLPADPQHLRHVERAGAVEPLLERLAGDELHHQVRQRLLLDGVDLHDVLVPDLRPTTGPRAGTACGPARWRPAAGPAP